MVKRTILARFTLFFYAILIPNSRILVLEGEMPEEKMSVALALKIKFFDNFKKG